MTSLNQLHGKLSAIFTGAFFHLFKFDGQEHVARLLAGLLSPLPGSMLFGVQGGRAVKGEWRPAEGTRMNCHSPESWVEMWDGEVFEKGTVRVEATLKEVQREDLRHVPNAPGTKFYLLVWSVTRL